MARIPSAGTPAVIRRGRLGAYFIDIQGEREIRVRRLR